MPPREDGDTFETFRARVRTANELQRVESPTEVDANKVVKYLNDVKFDFHFESLLAQCEPVVGARRLCAQELVRGFKYDPSVIGIVSVKESLGQLIAGIYRGKGFTTQELEILWEDGQKQIDTQYYDYANRVSRASVSLQRSRSRRGTKP